MRPFRFVPLMVLLCGCGGATNGPVETLEVQRGDFVISLLAEGELQAAESTSIMPPRGSRNPRTIAWLAPNFGAVREGGLIARFDVSDAELGALEAGIELSKVDLQVDIKERELQRLLSNLVGELDIIDVEKAMAEEFGFEDTLAYSRFEIIDATLDRELLDYRAHHLRDKKGTYSDRHSAEIELLDAQRATQLSESERHLSMLWHSEVRAPHDGFIVYEKNWWGLEVSVGTTVFPGNKIATIPNLKKMEAVLQVLETEAVGLAIGQRANVIIDAYPERPLTGTVSYISATATSIEQGNPVKYFSVVVNLDQADPEWIKPGGRVRAEIHISQAPNSIAVPNQALFQDGRGDWVLVVDGGKLNRRPVMLGTRGANRSEVIDGLQVGEEIALFPPSERL